MLTELISFPKWLDFLLQSYNSYLCWLRGVRFMKIRLWRGAGRRGGGGRGWEKLGIARRMSLPMVTSRAVIQGSSKGFYRVKLFLCCGQRKSVSEQWKSWRNRATNIFCLWNWQYTLENSIFTFIKQAFLEMDRWKSDEIMKACASSVTDIKRMQKSWKLRETHEIYMAWVFQLVSEVNHLAK